MSFLLVLEPALRGGRAVYGPTLGTWEAHKRVPFSGQQAPPMECGPLPPKWASLLLHGKEPCSRSRSSRDGRSPEAQAGHAGPQEVVCQPELGC